MPIIRKKINTNYTKLWNGTVQNSELSLRAKGLLWYMLSLPDDWDFTIKGIASQLKESEKIIINTLHELEEFGYHKKEHLYENGRIKDWIYYIYSEPEQEIIDNYKLKKGINNENQDSKKQDVQNQQSCFEGDKQTIYNKLYIDNKKTNKINNKKENFCKDKNFTTQKNMNEFLNSKTNIEYDKEKKKLTKAEKIHQIQNEVEIYSDNKEIQRLLNLYLEKRMKRGLDIEQWKIMLEDLSKYCKTDEEKINQIRIAYSGDYKVLIYPPKQFIGTPKTSYSSKSSFDNTASHIIPTNNLTKEEYNKLTHEEKIKYVGNLPVADMTNEQYEFFEQYCLARDENGNLIEF